MAEVDPELNYHKSCISSPPPFKLISRSVSVKSPLVTFLDQPIPSLYEFLHTSPTLKIYNKLLLPTLPLKVQRQ